MVQEAINTKAAPQCTDETISRLKEIILGAERDLFSGDKTVAELELPNNARLILMYGKRDTRRSMDPLKFDHKTTWCFCKLGNSSSKQICEFSTASNLFIDNESHRAMQYSRVCGPEPTAEHFSDMLQLAHILAPSPIITVVNLHGSGASIPQHFHTQLVPLACRRGLSPGSLLENIRFEPMNYSLHYGRICAREIVAPMWGVQLQFDDAGYEPTQIGQMLFQAIHWTRYRSQLYLSYNLYVSSVDPGTVTVLFREVYKECPFQAQEVLDLVMEMAGTLTAERIRDSDNARWRWGWLECIGGLPAKDGSFTDTDIFNDKFWKRVYDFMTFDEKYRVAVWRQIKEGLTNGLNSLV